MVQFLGEVVSQNYQAAKTGRCFTAQQLRRPCWIFSPSEGVLGSSTWNELETSDPLPVNYCVHPTTTMSWEILTNCFALYCYRFLGWLWPGSVEMWSTAEKDRRTSCTGWCLLNSVNEHVLPLCICTKFKLMLLLKCWFSSFKTFPLKSLYVCNPICYILKVLSILSLH